MTSIWARTLLAKLALIAALNVCSACRTSSRVEEPALNAGASLARSGALLFQCHLKDGGDFRLATASETTLLLNEAPRQVAAASVRYLDDTTTITLSLHGDANQTTIRLANERDRAQIIREGRELTCATGPRGDTRALEVFVNSLSARNALSESATDRSL